MKKIKLYDYQQKMLEDIINVLTSAATSKFYNENGKMTVSANRYHYSA